MKSNENNMKFKYRLRGYTLTIMLHGQYNKCVYPLAKSDITLTIIFISLKNAEAFKKKLKRVLCKF